MLVKFLYCYLCTIIQQLAWVTFDIHKCFPKLGSLSVSHVNVIKQDTHGHVCRPGQYTITVMMGERED